MFGIGVPELIIILIIGLIVFGPGKLPEIGRGLGKTIREFRRVSSGIMDEPASTSNGQIAQKSEDVQAGSAMENITEEAKKIEVKDDK